MQLAIYFNEGAQFLQALFDVFATIGASRNTQRSSFALRRARIAGSDWLVQGLATRVTAPRSMPYSVGLKRTDKVSVLTTGEIDQFGFGKCHD